MLKAIPGYVVSSKLTWAAGDHVPRNQISTKPKISNPGVRTLYYTSEISEKLNFMIYVQIDRYLTHLSNWQNWVELGPFDSLLYCLLF